MPTAWPRSATYVLLAVFGAILLFGSWSSGPNIASVDAARPEEPFDTRQLDGPDDGEEPSPEQLAALERLEERTGSRQADFNPLGGPPPSSTPPSDGQATAETSSVHAIAPYTGLLGLTMPEPSQVQVSADREHLIDPVLAVGPFTVAEFTSPETPAGGESAQAPNDFSFFELTPNLGAGAPSAFSSMVNEPSVARDGDDVFMTYNWGAARSSDGGATFAFLDPYTLSQYGGFCCDQVTVYDPSRNVMVWLRQYAHNGVTNAQRLDIDVGFDGTFDCAYNITPGNLGLPDGWWLDFPDLVVGANDLYHTSNIGQIGSPLVSQAVMIRYSLDDIANCGGLSLSYHRVTDRVSFRATHGASTTIYWAARNSTSSIRIYRWSEGDGTMFFEDRTITSFPVNTPYLCGQTANPGGSTNFCGRADSRTLGAWRSPNGVIGFMWNASQGTGGFGTFPYPYVQVATFSEATRALVSEAAIWSPAVAFIYPSVAVNSRGHIAGTIFSGGGSTTPSCLAWISDDINGEVLAPLENYLVIQSSHWPSASSKWGDYLSARPNSPSANSWVATCFSLQGGSANGNTEPAFVWFGRERDGPPTPTPTASPTPPTPSPSPSPTPTPSPSPSPTATPEAGEIGYAPAVVQGNTWHLRNSNTGGAADITFTYGRLGDTHLMCDWDGDGVRTPGVVRGNTWHLRNSNTSGPADVTFTYGRSGDIPICGDWDGSLGGADTDTPGVVRGNTWYLRNSNTGGAADITFSFGRSGDIPIVGDWGGSCCTDKPGVVRGNTWYLRDSVGAGPADRTFTYGRPGDIPIAGDWDVDSLDTPGVVRGNTWHLRNSNSGGAADISFPYGRSGDIPLVWKASVPTQ